ncbi:MAG: nucleotidyltransferase family protein [Acidobacteria bacterium]|nr:nucleotidyltransferase family protein [Acidobacteriota bacterium]
MTPVMNAAAILAGGLGTRLSPETSTLPKALVDVAGEPFIAHQLRLLTRNGIRRVVVCVGFLGEMIREAIGDGATLGVSIEYSFDGPTLLGTGGALRKALPLLGDAFFVVYGDSYLDCDYPVVQRAFEASGKNALMTVFRNDNRLAPSNVRFVDGRILRYDKNSRTPEMRHIDYGVGLFKRAVFETIEEGRPCDLAEVYAGLLARDDLAAFEVPSRFYEIGSPEGLEDTRAYLKNRDQGSGTMNKT